MLLVQMVIMVTNMTNDETPIDDGEARVRMRKRFQELDEYQRKKEEASSAWAMVLYFGFLITFIGSFMMLFFLGIVPLNLEMIISSIVILFGVFVMAIALFIKNAPSLVLAEL